VAPAHDIDFVRSQHFRKQNKPETQTHSVGAISQKKHQGSRAEEQKVRSTDIQNILQQVSAPRNPATSTTRKKYRHNHMTSR